MSIAEGILKEIKCCLSNYDHIAFDPVLLNCDGNACNKCIYELAQSDSNCRKCLGKHDLNDLLFAPDNKMTKRLTEKYLNEIFTDLTFRLNLIKDRLKDDSVLDELRVKIERIENEIDIRVESIVSKAHSYGDQLRMELNKFKESFLISLKNDEVLKVNIHETTTQEISYAFCNEKQNELQMYKNALDDFTRKINRLEFIPSTFDLEKVNFGELTTKAWISESSLILTENESFSLIEMTQSINGVLLYRATSDGFDSKVFHLKCDGKANTITIIKNNYNYVFGGYTSATWDNGSNGRYSAFKTDPNAFVFSLRRKGVSKNEMFIIKKSQEAICCSLHKGPSFGFDDIDINERPNIETGSYSNIGGSYQCPLGYTYNSNESKTSFLAGNFKNWLVTEIEVYQII